MERRLAAILAADVVGYSRLMEADEEATLATLSAYRRVIDGLVADHRGRVFGSAGDSVIAEFASPVEARRRTGAKCGKALGRVDDAQNSWPGPSKLGAVPLPDAVRFRVVLTMLRL